MDSAEKDGYHKAARPERGKSLISGNYAITGWLVKEKGLDELLTIPASKKVFPSEIPYLHSIRIAYQTPVEVNYNGTSKEALSSTFEDSLVYTNYELFKNIQDDVSGCLVKKVHDAINEATAFENLHEKIYETLRSGKSDQKAEFALDVIYTIDPKEITVPAYIAEGFEWLQTLLHLEE